LDWRGIGIVIWTGSIGDWVAMIAEAIVPAVPAFFIHLSLGAYESPEM
jgi:hypothetical protein